MKLLRRARGLRRATFVALDESTDSDLIIGRNGLRVHVPTTEPHFTHTMSALDDLRDAQTASVPEVTR